MGCCHSHRHSDGGEKKIDTPPSGSSLPLELDEYCSRKLHPHLTSSGTSRHSPPLPPVVAAGSTDVSSKSPPFLEEESVKEVIPESANRRSSSLMPSSLTPPPPPNAAWFPPQPPDLVDRVVKINVGVDEETSEIYSASESLSTSTIPEKMQEGDDWGDHKMLDRDRAEQSPMPTMSNNTWTSPSKFHRRSRGGGSNSRTGPNGGGDDSAAYSHSPHSGRRLEGGMRRPQESLRRPLRGGSRAGGLQMGVISSRNVPAAPGPEDKRNGRIRSRSPAMRSGECHNSSNSMGRTQNADAGEDKAPGGEADSLDNPLVSLECFIFL